jgi:hypothetical protein
MKDSIYNNKKHSKHNEIKIDKNSDKIIKNLRFV